MDSIKGRVEKQHLINQICIFFWRRSFHPPAPLLISGILVDTDESH